MRQKTAIRYLRISTDRQSNFSIDGQDMQTKSWCDRNNVEIVATFIDEGYSATNFDRPDMKSLNAFIGKHYRTTDYLVVNAFDRFSRQAGEAIVAIKSLQKKYAVKVVSVSEGVTFDADDPGSFFYAGMMLLKGEDEIIRNRGRINMGIFTAKKKEGRYLGAAPLGYSNARDESRKPIIVVNDLQAVIIRYLYEAFLNNVPYKDMTVRAKELGYKYTSHSYIQKMLRNPVYTGLLHVSAYKENPEELVEGIHDAIISRTTWYAVQDKLNGKDRKPVQIVNDDMPLRSVLKCYCGVALTGAPSRSGSGTYYNYYKCKVSRHLNLSATRAHDQLLQVLKYLSVDERLIRAIKQTSEDLLERRLQENSTSLKIKYRELDEAESKLHSVEEKWILNQMNFDTYQRWHRELSQQTMSLRAQIEKINTGKDELYFLLQSELEKLVDMPRLYLQSTTLQKQQLVRQVFDSQLYYKEHTYRTGYIMPVFAHNILILKEKNLLVLDEKRGLSKKVPSGGAEQSLIELTALLLTTQQIQVA